MKVIKKFLQNRFFYLGFALCLTLYPHVIARPAESETKTIVTSVGVDVLDEGIEVSLNIIIPKTSTDVNANTVTISEKGINVNECMEKVSHALGKWVGLAHCEAVFFNSKAFDEDVCKYLDYFVRTNNLTTNSIIFLAEETAKETLNLMREPNEPYSIAIKNIVEYNDDMYLPLKMNIKNFYKAYYSPQATAVLGVVGVTSAGDSGGGGEDAATSNTSQPSSGDVNLNSENSDSSNSAEDAGAVSGGGGKKGGAKKLYNQNKMAVVKAGKLKFIFEGESKNLLNILSPKVIPNYISIHNVSVTEFKDATISAEIYAKKIKKRAYFANGIPVFELTGTLNVKLDEVNSDTYSVLSLDETNDFFYDSVKEKMLNKLRLELAKIINLCREEKVDLFAVYDSFFKPNPTVWKEFLQNLPSQDQFLNYVIFTLDFDIKNKL